MHLNSILASSLLTGAAVAQQVVSFVEPRSQIKFVSLSRGAFNFGISLSKDPNSKDFIGHLAGSKSMGWAGGALGSGMVGPLLLVAWPNGKDVVSSIRKAPNKRGSPPVYKGDAKLVTIPAGTYVSDNGFSYTFVCQGCLNDPSVAFASNATSGKFAYAASPQPVSKVGDVNTPLTMHTIGMGGFNINLAAARSDQYSTWAALTNGAMPAPAAAAPAAPAAPVAAAPAPAAVAPAPAAAAADASPAAAAAPVATPAAPARRHKRHGPDYAGLVNSINAAASSNSTAAAATPAPAVAKRHGPDYAGLVNSINVASNSTTSKAAA